MVTIGKLGEFGLIDRIKGLFPSSPNVIQGIGDDCAVVRAGDKVLVLTCDLSIENVHFRRGPASLEDIGWKALAVSLSDVAAMGCVPQFVTVSLAAPGTTRVEDLEAIGRGMAEVARAHGAAIVGGDTTESREGLILDTFVLGMSPFGEYVSRDGAQPGDVLAVTGSPGDASAGLHAQESGTQAAALLKALHRPNPRVREGQWLAGQGPVRAMIDVSDGLVQDAGHLAHASGLGVEIERKSLPISKSLGAYCDKAVLSPHDFALTGGDAYELLFAVSEEGWEELRRGFGKEFDLPLTAVGKFVEGDAVVRVDGKAVKKGGYEHFRSG